ncbi:MAG: phage major capsid protein [Oscillospiraceae bacterium]|nr:phage major capsid protein [Oscillospiraceae bacterium]
MSTTNELRNQRARIWEQAKAFLDSHRDKNGILTAEDTETYERMEQDIVSLGKEIERQDRLDAFERELKAPTSEPLTSKPDGAKVDMKTGRASDEYRKNFWNALRSKYPLPSVTNALQVGTDSEGGYLVPDEFERTLIEALEEENFFRRIATVIHSNSGDRKIPVVASKGTAGWIDEEGLYPESDDSFGQLSLGAYKLGTMIKISEELLNDSAFDMEGYITREFARRIGTKEEESFFSGDGTGKPVGILAENGGAEVGVTTASGTAMWRGTTPTYSFTLPEGVRLSDFSTVYLTFAQNGKTVLEKTIDELEPTDDGFRLLFSQADTLCFSPGAVKIQLRARMPDGTAVASNVISTTAQEVLKDGEI